MFLPEGVWFDEQSCVDVGGKRLLQRPQHRLHTVPLTAAHVHHHGKAASTYILTDRQVEADRQVCSCPMYLYTWLRKKQADRVDCTWVWSTGKWPAGWGLPVLFDHDWSWQGRSGLVRLVCHAHLENTVKLYWITSGLNWAKSCSSVCARYLTQRPLSLWAPSGRQPPEHTLLYLKLRERQTEITKVNM